MENKCPICNQDSKNCNCKRKGKKLIFLLIIFLAIYFGIINATKIYTNSTNPHTITVSGKGEISAVPNIGVITFTVRSADTAGDTQKMQSDIAAVTGNVFSKLKSLGVEEKDIETTNYQVNPKYGTQSCSSKVQTMTYPAVSCNTNVVTGYEASESVNVKVRDTKNISEVLSIIADSKITEVSGPNFELDNIDKLKDEARDKAIIDAKEKAKSLGKSLGVKINKIISFSEDNGGGYPMMMLKATSFDSGVSEASPSPNIAAGEQKITSNVYITFEIDN
ncbi:MAG: SIMPL domain-containing protein [Candidatus Pacebacteria bacterium]|nr:SIMPL domain-containing protein [Candidatus Paceibacterota bacterium]